MLPVPIQFPAAWLGPERTSSRRWIEHLDANAVAELETPSGSVTFCASGCDRTTSRASRPISRAE
jgi:hypothetical protein